MRVRKWGFFVGTMRQKLNNNIMGQRVCFSNHMNYRLKRNKRLQSHGREKESGLWS